MSIFKKAKQDSLVTGDRYVPVKTIENGLASFWGVVDTHMDHLVESGLAFDVACKYADDLSKQHKTHELENQ